MRALSSVFLALYCRRLSTLADRRFAKISFSRITPPRKAPRSSSSKFYVAARPLTFQFSPITFGWAYAGLCFLWTLGALAQQLTPGDVFDVTIQDMCTPGYSKKVRAVPRALRIQAYRKYGITSWEPGDYQLDHLIPLSLGGSIRNLWPQSYRTSPWNAHVKDVLERRLHNLVCNGKVDLQTAQQEIATDWIKAYQKYVAISPTASDTREPHPEPGERSSAQ